MRNLFFVALAALATGGAAVSVYAVSTASFASGVALLIAGRV